VEHEYGIYTTGNPYHFFRSFLKAHKLDIFGNVVTECGCKVTYQVKGVATTTIDSFGKGISLSYIDIPLSKARQVIFCSSFTLNFIMA